MGGVAVTALSTAPPLSIEIAEEGREENDDDVEAEVWPPAGKGIQHIRIRVNRDAMLPYGARIDEVGSVDAGSVSFPSSPCLLYTSPSPRDKRQSRMPSSA